MSKLRIEYGEPYEVRLHANPFRIGRSDDNDLVLPYDFVSRHHCEIHQAEGRFRLVDLESRMGLSLNKLQVNQTVLNHGDRIGIGPNFAMVFLSVAPQRSDGTVRRGDLNSPVIDPDLGLQIFRLLALDGPIRGKTLLLKQGLTRIGRDMRNDLIIPADTISKFHAEIYVKGDIAQIKDLDSINGTMVNNNRTRNAELASGDRITLDKYNFVLERAELPTDPTMVSNRQSLQAMAHSESAKTAALPTPDAGIPFPEAPQQASPARAVAQAPHSTPHRPSTYDPSLNHEVLPQPHPPAPSARPKAKSPSTPIGIWLGLGAVGLLFLAAVTYASLWLGGVIAPGTEAQGDKAQPAKPPIPATQQTTPSQPRPATPLETAPQEPAEEAETHDKPATEPPPQVQPQPPPKTASLPPIQPRQNVPEASHPREWILPENDVQQGPETGLQAGEPAVQPTPSIDAQSPLQVLQISSLRVDPRRAVAGQVVAVAFDLSVVEGPLSLNTQMTLLRGSTEVDTWRAPQGDRLPTGRHQRTESFRIPPGSPPGLYKLRLSLVSDAAEVVKEVRLAVDAD